MVKKIFTAKLENTKLGNVFFNWLLPIGSICYSLYGIISKEITIQRFTYTGLNAQTMGVAIILLTIAIWGGEYITLKLGKRYYITILFFVSLGLVLYSTYNSYLLIEESLNKPPESKEKTPPTMNPADERLFKEIDETIRHFNEKHKVAPTN